jgi:hypothetical protein
MYTFNCSFRSRLIASATATLMLVTTSSAMAYATRGTTRTSVNSTSVHRSASASSTSVNRSASASSASVNRSASVSSTSVNTANVNRNVNVNSTTVNVNKNVNVNTGCCYNNVGTAGAVAAGVAAGIVVGSVIAASALPPKCSAVIANGVTYQNCGGAWYQPQYAGSQVTYIVVNPPK